MSKKKPAPKNIPTPRQADPKRPTQKGIKKGPEGNKMQWAVLAALAVLTFFVFYPTVKVEFTNWDDGTYVSENPDIWKLDAEHVKNIFIAPKEKRTESVFFLVHSRIAELPPSYYAFAGY